MIEEKFLGLDLGDAWVGVAISLLPTVVVPKESIHYDSFDQLVATLQKLVETHEITTIVVGMPVGLTTAETAQTRTIQEMVQRIRETVHTPVVTFDERYTSKLASTLTKGVHIHKNETHSIAAQKMLEDYLTHRGVQEKENN